MGSWSFNAWKVLLILICLAGFAATLIGYDTWKSYVDAAVKYGGMLLEDELTFSYRYNEAEGGNLRTLRKVEVHGQELMIETVDDEAGIQKGLSDRSFMPDDEGLLFDLPGVDIYPFWMYRMRFPIDMIWIRNGVVVEIAPNMPPPSETGGIPKTYTPSAEADMVLELTAGGAERYGISVGDMLDF